MYGSTINITRWLKEFENMNWPPIWSFELGLLFLAGLMKTNNLKILIFPGNFGKKVAFFHVAILHSGVK